VPVTTSFGDHIKDDTSIRIVTGMGCWVSQMLGEVSDPKMLSGFLARCPKFDRDTDFEVLAKDAIRGGARTCRR
jgi:hypothetical protein